MSPLRRLMSGLSVAGCVALTLAGCSSVSQFLTGKSYVKRDFPSSKIRTIAVAPFLNLSPEENVDTLALADIFFREFQSFRDVILVPPIRVQAEIVSGDYAIPEDGRKLADHLGVDAVVFGVITSYEPYSTQQVGIAVLMYTARDFGLPSYGPEAIMIMSQSGRPVTLSGEAEPTVIVSARMFDSSDRATVARIKEFARGFSEEETPLGYKTFVTSPNRFMQFVSHEMVLELAATVEERFKTASGQEER